MSKRTQVLVAFIGLWSFFSNDVRGAEWVTLYVAPFKGPSALGQSVATILNLQLLDQMRVPVAKVPKVRPTVGVVVWGRQPLEMYSHEDAEARAKEIALLAQLVFWGKVYEFGDGAIAQTNLSIPRYKDVRQSHPERWQLNFSLDDGALTFEADMPQRRYSFRPIVLTKDVIRKYSRPNSIEIHEKGIDGPVIGYIGDEFDLLGVEGDLANVESGKLRGWIRLPSLSSRHSEAVNFSSGIVRVLRGDWTGVAQLMQPISKDEDAPNELRTDAHLYLGLAAERQGRSGRGAFAAALELSPNARRCVIYSVIGELSEYSRLLKSDAKGELRAASLARARNIIKDNIALFPPEDPWMRDVLKGIDRLRGGSRVASIQMLPAKKKGG